MATEARGTHCCPCLPRHMPVSFPPRSPQSSVVHYESPGPLTFHSHLPPQAMAACATGCGRVWLLSGQALAFLEKIIFVYECACINVHVCTYSCVRLCVRYGEYVEVRGQPRMLVHTFYLVFATICVLQASWFASFWRILLSLTLFSP